MVKAADCRHQNARRLSSYQGLTMEYDEFSAMNTTVLVAAEGNLADLRPGFARVRRFVAAAESSILPPAEAGWGELVRLTL